MYSLITFATQWGSKHGGINSFNTDFLEAFGFAYHNNVQVVCIVTEATDDEIEEARNSYVTLLPLPYPPKEKIFANAQAQASVDLLRQKNISFDPNRTVWLGHDRITGAAAIEAAKIVGGRSALIHHMSYAHYETYAEDSQTAHLKNQEQQRLFKQSDLILAIGPLLRDAAHDLVSGTKPVHMLVPGLAEIEVQQAPKTFTAFLGGRLSGDAARVKQGYLSIAALAHAHKKACEINMPDGLCRQPRLMLRGVDFASEVKKQPEAKPEAKLKAFAEKYAGRALTVLALPYTHDRQELYNNISRASAVMMLSWHEGFGLAAWEAIAAGVPLIVSMNSGVYKLLEEKHPGCEKGFIYPIDVQGTNISPFFRNDDLESAAVALREIAHNPEKARQKAATLRGLLLNEYSWTACAEQAARIFSWPIQKGILPAAMQELNTTGHDIAESQPTLNDLPVRMPPKRWQADGIVADSQLLRAEEALVPFDPARQPELDKLDAWLDDAKYTQAVRLLTGAGGLGKTRLALHLCEQRIISGWHAGFLDSGLKASELTLGWKALRTLKQPMLIVIDYAESRQEELLTLVLAILQLPTTYPVRILLLARDGGEWWDNLPSKNKDCEMLLSSYATTGPYHLSPLHEGIQDRQLAYKQALHAFAQALGVPTPEVIPSLEGEHFGRPLYLQMAALLALHGERPITAQGLTRALLHHERRYWQGVLNDNELPEPARHAEQLLALTTLAGGFVSTKTAMPHWERANGKLLSPTQFSQLFHALTPLYLGKQGLQAVRPDLLGEALVAQTLFGSSGVEMLDAVLGKDAGKVMRLNALTVIARLSNHYQELHETLIEALKRHFAHCWQEFITIATETPSNLPSIAESAFTRLPATIKDQIAGLLKPYIVEESMQLGQFYSLVAKHQMQKCHQKYLRKASDAGSIGEYASALNGYGNCLVNLGRNEEAMPYTLQSLEIYQRLSKKLPKIYMEDYAGLLSNYANRLAELGQDNEALSYAEQSLAISRGLAQKTPERCEPTYALSLSNYSSRLDNVGRSDDAIAHSLEALTIRQRLAQKYPDRFESELAVSLSNYAGLLGEGGRNEEALDYALKALKIRQHLAQKNRDRFESDHAISLNNYASALSDVDRNDEALDYSRDALEIRQRLAQKNPDRFEPEYASSLNNYAGHLSNAGQNDKALDCSFQALTINQRLTQKNPDRYAPDLAISLNNYASNLTDAGRNKEALDFSHQALEIRQRLVKKNPNRYEPDLATSLNNYASHLSDVGSYKEALVHVRDALSIRQQLAKKAPARFAEDRFWSTFHALILGWLANDTCEVGNLVELNSIPATVPSHRRPLLLLSASFAQACLAHDQTTRSETFHQAAAHWSELSKANKTAAQEYWLCAAAWCAAHESACIGKTDWLVEWHQFLEQKQGSVPCWMQEVARRLEFQWPE